MYVKDSNGLIINTDVAHYKSIIMRRNQRKTIDNLNDQIKDVNSELHEIKLILTKLLDGQNYG